MALLRRTSLVWQASWTSTLTFEIFQCSRSGQSNQFLNSLSGYAKLPSLLWYSCLNLLHQVLWKYRGIIKYWLAIILPGQALKGPIRQSDRPSDWWKTLWWHRSSGLPSECTAHTCIFFIPLLENALGHNDSFLFAHGLKECKSCDLSWLWC